MNNDAQLALVQYVKLHKLYLWYARCGRVPCSQEQHGEWIDRLAAARLAVILLGGNAEDIRRALHNWL
jgi:hypothetical protein